jgi:protoporphyrinogen oxidase/nucleoside-diphosphate-sugar epimerase
MRVLVTGGAGFIGSHLCDRLLADGHEVICFDNLETGSMANLAHAIHNPRFRFVTGDICDGIADLAADRIYHLACPDSPTHYRRDPIGTFRTAVIGTLSALNFATESGSRMVYASTSEVYGDPTVHPQPESYPGLVNPIGLRACYDEGKRAAETACADFHRYRDIDVRVARIFSTYGPRMGTNDGRVVSNFIAQAIAGNPIAIYGAGTHTRSFTFIDDMIEGLVRLMEVESWDGGPVNIGTPSEMTVRELAELVIEHTGNTSTLTFEDLPLDDPRLRKPDISRATELLAWSPKVSIGDGLNQTINWFRAKQLEQQQAVPATPGPGQKVVAIIGGGPAGLTAAYELQKHSGGFHPVVFEEADQVGGIARTEKYKGYRFDIGGHRFFTKVKSVEALWREVLPEEFLRRPRMSRIYYQDKYYAYPLKIFNALFNMGAYESGRIMLSYLKWRVRPHNEEVNFQQWVTNRFGGRLFLHFFKSYTEKVWGMPCTEIQADWAAQRIKNLSLRKAVWNALTGSNDTTSLIEEFDYPRLGPGMMWDAFNAAVTKKGGEVRMQSSVTGVFRDETSIRAIQVTTKGDAPTCYRFEADHFISSMPISTLIDSMIPPAPPAIRDAAGRLKYRDFLIVTLILKSADLFPDNWIYIHSPAVQVGRIQNFRSWSDAMVPDPSTSSIGMEYFCQEGDDLWNKSNDDLIAQATAELAHLGLKGEAEVVDGTVIRQPKAYPVYDDDYRESLDLIRGWLSNFENIQVVGRNGMHRYNNQDHSMLTAMLSVQNILGGKHDLWSVNVEKEYHEDIEASADVSRGNSRKVIRQIEGLPVDKAA